MPQANQITEQPYLMRIGKRRYPVASLEEASAKVCAARDAVMRRDFSASTFKSPLIFDRLGSLVGYVSWNGRVWAGRPEDWKSGQQPLCEAQG